MAMRMRWMRWIDGGYAMDAIAIQHSHAHAMDAMDRWMRWIDGCHVMDR